MRILIPVAALAAALASPAAAHVSLTKATPAAKAAVSAPSVIELQFNGKVEPKLSAFDLVRADGTKVALKPQPPSADGRRLAAIPAQPLAAGAYKVDWRIVSSDGHRMTGGYDFTVR